ncbi:MAG: hypothetical protein HC830_13000 [Bacteroidetes bacterium]|nr:hypothetical protein [Bacteroidota bacterium]
MFYSQDFRYGFHDLQIKLPLLILPVIIGTTKPVDYSRFLKILMCFCAAVVISSFISTGKLFGFWGPPVMDVRDISFMISHIRLALMVNMAVFILIWYTFSANSAVLKILSGSASVWLIIFLVILKSLTGVLIFLLLVITLLIWKAIQGNNFMLKWFLSIGAILIVLLGMAYITNNIAHFFYVEKTDIQHLEKYTAKGNPYFHNIHSKDFENGNYTWLYICEPELEESWNNRSRLNFKGTDLKGQELRYTLIRYLTSKGLRKDAAGITSLSDEDIANIEKGWPIIYTPGNSAFIHVSTSCSGK